MIVLDTNAVLYFLAGRLADGLPPGAVCVSVITEMELLSYPALNAADEAAIRAFLHDVTILELNRDIKTSAIALRRQSRLKLPDAIIAATAQHLQAVLLTNDLKLLDLPHLTTQALRLLDVT